MPEYIVIWRHPAYRETNWLIGENPCVEQVTADDEAAAAAMLRQTSGSLLVLPLEHGRQFVVDTSLREIA